ncbi:MAG: hypothetical protein AB7O59_21790 [Pirellulales bacterium]
MRLASESTQGHRLIWACVGLSWAAASAGGLFLLAAYSNTPSAIGAAPRQWPPNEQIPLSSSEYTLLFFAHPKCPCTAASLGELEKVLARCPNEASVWTVFYEPRNVADPWQHSDLCRRAATIPGVHVVRDIDGALAQRFGAGTSGQTLLYNPRGDLLFNGGITFARGHSGDNAGASAIELRLAGEPSDCERTEVFGCSIID